MELPSLSALRSKSFSNPGAILMSPNAAPHAARQERQSDLEMATTATGPSGKCFPQYAPSAAKRPKYHSSPVKVDQYTVAIATVKSDQVGNTKIV